MLNKMLRATLLKLKKVCFESLTPRIFRGDYYIPGKFEKFCTTSISRAQKSTDAGKGSEDDDEKCQKIINEIFNKKVEEPKVSEDPTLDPNNIQELKREQISQIVSPETDSQICEKLIAQAFGKDGDGTKLPDNAVVSATTAKQTEEQLAQKLETIDETPLVEAEKPNIEGFNVSPKVLGAEENVNLGTLNFERGEKDVAPNPIIDEKTKNDLEELCQKIERSNRFYHAGSNLYKMPEFNKFETGNPMDPTYTGTTLVNHPYDDIAKRCVNIPSNKIDRHILRELTRLGVPNSSGYGSKSDNIGNEDNLSKQMNDYNLQRGKGSPPNEQVLNPPHENEQLKVERSMIHELDKKPMPLCMMEQNVIDDTIMTLATVGPKPEFNPNRMLLDPFDKKSLCYDCVDPEYEMVSYDKVHVLVQRLENKNYIEENAEEEQTHNLQTNLATNAEQSDHKQSAEQTQSHIKPEHRAYEIKPLHESPRLPERPINFCNENLTIHPLNREQHYSMKPFQDSENRHNQMNYQESMVPNQSTNQPHHLVNQQNQHLNQQHQHENQQHQQQEYYVNTPLNQQDQQQYFWNRDYQNYYGNRFQGGEQYHQMTPKENSPNLNLPQEQQSNTNKPAVHVFTNAATHNPETLESVLPQKENVSTKEAAENIEQEKQKQAGNIFDENIAPENIEQPTISQQYYFNEQNPQYFQQGQPTEQEHLGRPFAPNHLSMNEHLFDLRRQPIEAHQELDIKEQTQSTEEAQTEGSVKVNSEELDKNEQPTEEAQTLYSEQLHKKEQPTDEAQIIGSVKVNSEELDKKEQQTEEAQTLHSQQLDKKQQPADEAQILGSVKGNSEELDKKDQSTEEAETLHSQQLVKNKQPAEEVQILGSVKVNSEELDKKEQPTDEAQILGSVKAHAEQLAKNEKSTEQAQILHSEQLDKNEPPNKPLQTLGSLKILSEQRNKKEQTTEQAETQESAKAHDENLSKQEPIQYTKVPSEITQKDMIDFTKQTIELELSTRVLDSVKVDEKQLNDKRERSIEFLASNSARKERLQLKKQAIQQLNTIATARPLEEKIERSIENVELLSSSKPQEQLHDLKETTKPAEVLTSVNTQEAPEEKVEQIQQNPKSEDPNDEFKKKLSSTILPLPKQNPDEQLPLSVLLKRLRERSKIETCHDVIDLVGKKCGGCPPPCPPPAPTCPPPKPCPPPPCPPPPPPCPKPCKPACPNPCGPPKPCCPPKTPPPCSKYIQVDTDFDFAAILRETDVYLKKRMYETVTAILTKDVIMQLEKMGVSLLITCPNEEIDLDNLEHPGENSGNLKACQVDSTGVNLARDYEPWVPIPSWPIPRKVKKEELVCPKHGCKIIPPPNPNPPCDQKPCTGFPKRKNSFSTPDSELSEDVSVRFES